MEPVKHLQKRRGLSKKRVQELTGSDYLAMATQGIQHLFGKHLLLTNKEQQLKCNLF